MKHLCKNSIALFLLLFLINTLIAQQRERPNILMIAVDDLRPELGCYGNTLIHSPNIDKLASEGVVFKNSYCNIPVCGASRASILTGTRPTQHRFSRHYDRADEQHPSAVYLAQHFKNNGYTTLSNGKISHIKDDHAASWDVNWRLQLNGSSYRDYVLPKNKELEKGKTARGPSYEIAEVPDSAYKDGRLALKVIKDIQRLKNSDQPFFLTAGFVKPHLPFNAPKKYWDLYERSDFKPVGQIKLPENAPKQAFHNFGELRNYHGIPKKGAISDSLSITLQHGYYATISYVDKLIGDVLEALEESGLRENTIVLLWGDHGWNLGDHGLWCKHCNFNTSLQAPLIISAPNLAKGATTESLVEFIDIYPTLTDLCGLETPRTVEGKSLLPLLQKPNAHHKDYIISKWRKGLTIKTKRYAYTEWRDEKTDTLIAEMLYDHAEDPDELNNLIGDPRYEALTAYLS
ncbi:MAG: sulfatase, partial [Bacteroidota bacterium]